MLSPEIIPKLILPAILIMIGTFCGIPAEIIIHRIKHRTHRNEWKSLEIIADSMRKLPSLWGILIGTYGALLAYPFHPQVRIICAKLLLVIIMFTIVLFTARLTGGFLHLYTNRVRSVFPSISLFTNLVKFTIFTLGFLIILQYLGISVAPILTALGVGGLAVALALQDTLSNLFAGIQIIASRQVKPGDYIKLSTGEEGYVYDITWRNTAIRSLSGNMIIAPNSKISTSILTNYHQPSKKMSIYLEISLNRSTNIELAEKVILETAREVAPEFDPAIRYHNLVDSNINLWLNFQIKEYSDHPPLKNTFIKTLNARFKKEGLDLPINIKLQI